ncbi:hypothetical protein [Fluviibacterium sp. S390]|uniref:hypothetical protein n=1 Tax=Fluviibacterium sp. S390 TaxID=3415139 RepID=UPI003C7E85F9
MILLAANSLKPFAFESVQILGLPSGCVFRARFPVQWIEKQFVDEPERLIGQDMVYALRIWETDEVLPLRRCKVVSSKKVGDIVFLEYSLGRLVAYSSQQDEITKQVSHFRVAHDAFLDKLPSTERAPNKPLRPLIVEVDDSLLREFGAANFTSPNDEERWMMAVNLLGGYSIFNGLPFYKFEILEQGSKTEAVIKNGTAALKSGRGYSLSALCLIADNNVTASGVSRDPDTPYMELGPYELSIATDANRVEVTPQTQPMSGRYDRLSFSFQSKSNRRSRETLRPTFSVPVEVSRSFRPVFDIPVAFSPTLWGVIWRILLGVLLLGIWLCLNYVDDIKDLLPQRGKDLVEQFSLVFFALTCVDLVKYVRELAKSS